MSEYSGTTIVTGGASGIGLATASWILARGRRVLVLDQSKSSLEAAKAALKEYAARVTFAELDVTDEGRMLEVIASHVPSDSPLVGLVNSAGYGMDIPFLETSSQILRNMLEVNLIGTFSISREVAKRMVTSGGGSIVHIASVSGLIGNKGRSAYGATKAALVNLTQVMSNELARYNIRVNCVCPGPIETPLAAAAHGGAGKEAWEKAVPMKRYGSPKEVASAVGFLLEAEDSSYVTGQVISVDGGFIGSGLLPV
jgi:NAD(P)-dependent dehydrogenase (short-subunit alcohol dehydrogenase family)